MRSDLPQSLKFATVWLVLGALVFVGYQWQRHEALKASFTTTAEGVVEIRRGADGHYHWPGRLNGVSVDFLVDISRYRDIKAEALRAHRTQHVSIDRHFFHLPNVDRILSFETFRQAFGPALKKRPAPDIFESIDEE
jgi:LmbE family N-acetylglucosaminyl deacetylase